MSFRSIGGLPRCLRDRLAFRRTSLPCDQVSCLRSSSSFAQAVVADNDTDGNNSHLTDTTQEPPSNSDQFPAPRVRFVPSNGIVNNGSRVNRLPSTQSSDRTLLTQEQSSHRVGGVLDIPKFMLKEPVAEQTPIHTDINRRRHTERRSTQFVPTTVYGKYQEWEYIHDKYLEAHRNQPAEIKEIFNEQIKLAKSFIGDVSDVEISSHEFRRKWITLTYEAQRKLLPALLVGSMAESAAMILFVLNNVEHMPYSFRIRMNCLRSIGLTYYKELQQDQDLKRTYETMIDTLRSPECWPRQKLPTVLLQNLLFWSSPEQCEKIIEDFQLNYPEAEASSVIAIVDHYIRIKDPEQAFKYLSRLPVDMLQQPDTFIKEHRDRLLMLDHIVRSESGTNFKYLPQLLALGIPPDEALHNTVIESAISNQMPDVAWDVYQYLESSKFKSNARTHLVLLRDSFQRGDLQRVNDIMTAMHSRDDLTNDQYLVAYSMNIVRVISYFEKKLKPKEALSHIMTLYDRAYDRSPLVKLGMVSPVADSPSLPMPSPTSLAFTIWTYILIQRRDRDIVLRLWEWIKFLISNGDEAMLAAARFDIIYNGFILFHARSGASLFRIFEVVQFMLSSKICLPTSRTWSIILCSLLKYGQTNQAEKVLVLMRSKGHHFQEISEKYGNYLPAEYDLPTMYDKIDQNLNEKDMPAGIEELLAESKSLQGNTTSNVQPFPAEHMPAVMHNPQTY